jgi:hypothetical protein
MSGKPAQLPFFHTADSVRLVLPGEVLHDQTHPELVNHFHKRSQLFSRSHIETFSVVATCVSNPDRSAVRING